MRFVVGKYDQRRQRNNSFEPKFEMKVESKSLSHKRVDVAS